MERRQAVSQSTINQYIQLFAQSLDALGVHAQMTELEQLALLAHRSMEQPKRYYHNSDHVFKLVQGMNCTQTLAGLFHDIVYVQLDDGFSTWTADWLSPVVKTEAGNYLLRQDIPADPSVQMCVGIFGFEPGQELSPFAGLNEFLSAIVAVRALSPYLPPLHLLAIVTCIEATVPFRGGGAHPFPMAQQLRSRVTDTADRLGLDLSETEVTTFVQDAIVLANRDVAGFGLNDPGQFLSDTWMLIDESNAPLARVGLYTLGDYRQALQRMAGFLKSLDYRAIFHEESPADGQLVLLQQVAKRNLAFSVRYLEAKLLSILIVEALAKLTGGDAPISMLLGDIRGAQPVKIEHFLSAKPEAFPEMDPFMLDILENGRPQPSRNDTAASPITAYLYRWLGEAGMSHAEGMARRWMDQEITPSEFLKSLPAKPMLEIIHGCAQISLSRRERLHALASVLFA
jgi:hypothetical protein